MRPLSPGSRRALMVGASLAAATLALTGCRFQSSNADTADLDNGKQLFVQSCGSCHVLDDAGTEGRIGPNLDDAFRGSRQAGIPESQFEGVTKRWIAISQAPMPRDLVTGQDADDVSAYVADVAAQDLEESTVRSALEPPPESPAIGTEDGQRRGRFGSQVNDVRGEVPVAPPSGDSDEGTEDDSEEGGE